MPRIRNGHLDIGIDTEGLSAVLGSLRAAAPGIRRRALRRAAEAIVGEAQFSAPVKTGTLKDAHVVDASDPDNVRIGANTTYAAAVHERHPTKGRWFLNAVVTKGPGILRKALAEAMEHAAKMAARRDSSGRFKSGGGS